MTTPRTDAENERLANFDWQEGYGNLLGFTRRLEAELVALQKERDQLLATISDLETRHAAAMLHTQTVVDENTKLLATVKGLRALYDAVGKYGGSITTGELEVNERDMMSVFESIKSLPPTNLVKRSVLLNVVESLEGKIPLSHDDKLNLKEANAELERTKPLT